MILLQRHGWLVEGPGPEHNTLLNFAHNSGLSDSQMGRCAFHERGRGQGDGAGNLSFTSLKMLFLIEYEYSLPWFTAVLVCYLCFCKVWEQTQLFEQQLGNNCKQEQKSTSKAAVSTWRFVTPSPPSGLPPGFEHIKTA